MAYNPYKSFVRTQNEKELSDEQKLLVSVKRAEAGIKKLSKSKSKIDQTASEQLKLLLAKRPSEAAEIINDTISSLVNAKAETIVNAREFQLSVYKKMKGVWDSARAST